MESLGASENISSTPFYIDHLLMADYEDNPSQQLSLGHIEFLKPLGAVLKSNAAPRSNPCQSVETL